MGNSILFFASAVFIYISYGCTRKLISSYVIDRQVDGIVHKMDNRYMMAPALRFIIKVVLVSMHILGTIIICKVFDLKWYWAFPINYLVAFFISNLVTPVYILLFGRRTKLQFNYDVEQLRREHLYGYDMAITMGISVLLFIIAIV